MGAVSNNYPVSNGAGANGADASSDKKTNGISGLANENTFLQLLVAQLKNQNPSQPMDGTTFVTQLAQFSELEQVIGIRGDVSKLATAATTANTTNTTTQTQA